MSEQDAGRPYGGRSLEQRRQMRRRALIDAGVRVYGNDGFRAATVKSICRQAGLTERYFYESFANSEALFAAVYKELVFALERDQLAAVNAAEPDPDAMARAGLTVFFKRMQDPLIARILLIEIFGISGDIDRLYRSASLGFARLLEDRLKAWFRVERLRGVDSRLLATGLIGSTIHIAMYWTLSDYREPLDTVVESSMTLYSALARSLPVDQ
ncbi:MAG: TetR/AcrR family transcriptional regulator [Salinisphaera sp.]|jgi:AcrR family transcriptional regulator|nr:TetR/AcrR family transcriptional regulator [Salinisphaera sp.]